MTNPQTWLCRYRVKNSHLNRQITDVNFLFIYVVAYQPSSYTEQMSSQRLMLKITSMRLLK